MGEAGDDFIVAQEEDARTYPVLGDGGGSRARPDANLLILRAWQNLDTYI
jgi:hypothetical protein